MVPDSVYLWCRVCTHSVCRDVFTEGLGLYRVHGTYLELLGLAPKLTVLNGVLGVGWGFHP